nr:MAG TPA_asm: hypothetical protein [Caudoviricetes sp.]
MRRYRTVLVCHYSEKSQRLCVGKKGEYPK